MVAVKEILKWSWYTKSHLNGITESDLLCSSDMSLKSIKPTWQRERNHVEEIGLPTRDLTNFFGFAEMTHFTSLQKYVASFFGYPVIGYRHTLVQAQFSYMVVFDMSPKQNLVNFLNF